MFIKMTITWHPLIKRAYKHAIEWLREFWAFGQPERPVYGGMHEDVDQIPPISPIKPVDQGDKELEIQGLNVPEGDLFIVSLKKVGGLRAMCASRDELKSELRGMAKAKFPNCRVDTYRCVSSRRISLSTVISISDCVIEEEEPEDCVGEPLPREDFPSTVKFTESKGKIGFMS